MDELVGWLGVEGLLVNDLEEVGLLVIDDDDGGGL